MPFGCQRVATCSSARTGGADLPRKARSSRVDLRLPSGLLVGGNCSPIRAFCSVIMRDGEWLLVPPLLLLLLLPALPGALRWPFIPPFAMGWPPFVMPPGDCRCHAAEPGGGITFGLEDWETLGVSDELEERERSNLGILDRRVLR